MGVIMNDMIENIARMTHKEQQQFVSEFVEKWPHLATQVMNLINLHLIINDPEEERTLN